MGAFGEKLRRQREQRGIALDAISSSTKISTRMLRALEEEKFDQLPGGVFNKGFVRAYARHIGLNEEQAISEYLEALRETQIQSQQILPNFRASKTDAATASTSNLPMEEARESAPQIYQHEPAASNHVKQPLVESIAPDSPGLRPKRSSVDAADQSNAGEDRRKVERRAEERRQAARRNDSDGAQSANVQSEAAHKSTSRTSQDRIKQDRIKQDRKHGEFLDELPSVPWQIEDRRAADLLSQVRQGKSESDHRSTQPAPLFSSGSFGESNISSGAPWGKIAAVLVVIFLLFGLWRVRHRNPSHSSVQAANRPMSGSDPASTQSSSTEPTPPQAPVTKTSLKTDDTGGSPRASNRIPNVVAKSTDPESSSSPVRSSTHALAAQKTPASFTLLIRAEKTSWISVTADGQPIAQETLIAPAETSIRASNEIVVHAGNAAGLSFLLNTKEIPVQGKDGEARTYTFNSSGLKSTASSLKN